jgi:hypothetical protein
VVIGNSVGLGRVGRGQICRARDISGDTVCPVVVRSGVVSKLDVMPDSVPWPEVDDGDRWAIELMEERLRETTRTPDELRARARELREQAAATEMKGVRDASLALAAGYEEAALARQAAS